jgi:DNA repair protein RadD
VFCAGVDHGAQLVEEFAAKGYNFVSISYKDSAELKEEAIKDFARPDTEIHGLIATDILTRGFDVPDVMIGVSARPVLQVPLQSRSADGPGHASV